MKWVLRIALGLVAVLVVLFLVFRTPDTDAQAMRAKYGGEPSRFVEIGDGTVVHLRDTGPRDGLPIMLLHGSNSDLHTWDEWAAGLEDSYRVIRFDQVGHGLTGPDPEGDYSRANYTEDVREVADALGLDRFVIGGNSMGGKHAMAFAAVHPERVLGLVLVDASGGPMLGEEELGGEEPGGEEDNAQEEDDDGSGNIGFAIAQLPGVNRIVEQVTPRSLIESSLEQSVSVKSVVTEAMIDRYWELLRYPGNRRATLDRFAGEYDPLAEEEIAGIDAPALILWGAEDRLIPLAAGRWLDRVMPDTRLVVYEGVGHLPQKEAPRRSLSDVREWLENRAFADEAAK
ncbi:alpha/beta fold hydrolase [Erythrobacter sp. HL-111]|uniref:alpha/beta fold hydrolase n=1 Tax=Erythrobacter sp. HL-111 TaxID=1798193 RepID=UPI0006DA0E37|nr:alpha/beta hydrolase [Erythrobacter sp. HL-111]KPP93436.1 MAG: putative hydrolases or acyltransferases (alpha/beta hydrolase superfamily) [Erythrobacteraceae bacterium HL-111]SDR69467.1 Pimeloyl-ACP methyl ester carboxylesterase [Erythrobacter sp. HL-111]